MRRHLAVFLIRTATLAFVAMSAFGALRALAPDRGASRPGEPRHGTAGTFTVYLDPAGSDSNGGGTPDGAVASLARALEVVKQANPRTDVEIRIAQGSYRAAPLRWTFFVPDHTISFLPAGYERGAAGVEQTKRPIFQGNGESGFWLSFTLPPDVGPTRLEFHYLQVERYDFGGIKLNGGTRERNGLVEPAGDGLNGNLITGMYFRRLGSSWAGEQDGYAAIDLVNSSRNVIRDNDFVEVENRAPAAGLMHGIYLAHYSRENTVSDSRFSRVSGDPLRVRNDSNDNKFYGNSFERTGAALLSGWFCDADCAKAEGHARECASHGNVLHNNAGRSAYSGGKVRNWALSPPGLDLSGGPGCDNEGEPRVETFDNETS